jgi:tRNA (mo5U34)-methyltransferase
MSDQADLATRFHALKGKFHSPFDFGDGLVTRPRRVFTRFQRRLRLLGIPENLSGKTVLDIGAWDGFFSFEFERRGAARVLAIDTHSWDHGALDCFLFARERLASKVEFRRMDVHELSPGQVGTFDLVFCAGVLYHMRNPLLGLERIRSVTDDQLILETHSLLPAFHEWVPLITFFPGDEDAPRFKWHHGGYPTRRWLLDALRAVGFGRTEVIYRPSFRWAKKLAALATNTPQRGRLIVHAFTGQDPNGGASASRSGIPADDRVEPKRSDSGGQAR